MMDGDKGKPKDDGTPSGRVVGIPAGSNERRPLDVLLDTMRWAEAQADEIHSASVGLEGKDLLAATREVARLRKIAVDVAKEAAPYKHHRLQAVEHSGAIGGQADRVKALAKAAGEPDTGESSE